jgi:hypothetical protein
MKLLDLYNWIAPTRTHKIVAGTHLVTQEGATAHSDTFRSAIRKLDMKLFQCDRMQLPTAPTPENITNE